MIQLQYVGIASCNSNQMILDIEITLQNLKLEIHFQGKMIVLTPDDLYHHCIPHLYLLPFNVMSQSFTLFTFFFHVFHLDYQEVIKKRGINYSSFISLPLSLFNELCLYTTIPSTKKKNITQKSSHLNSQFDSNFCLDLAHTFLNSHDNTIKQYTNVSFFLIGRHL